VNSVPPAQEAWNGITVIPRLPIIACVFGNTVIKRGSKPSSAFPTLDAKEAVGVQLPILPAQTFKGINR